MNDNDSIKRGDLKKQVLDYVRTHIVPTVTGVLALIDDAPAVQRDMTAREYHLIKRRMCKNCPVCPLNAAAINLFIDCKRFEREYPEKAVALVENWAEEHPERSEEA